VPIIVRLQGTNAAIAKELIDNWNANIICCWISRSSWSSKSRLLIVVDIKNPVCHGEQDF
jgi:succinyl-CoA synthetase beta subunit